MNEIDFVGATSGELLGAIMEERERAHDAEAVSARWEEAVAGLTWLLSRVDTGDRSATPAIPVCCLIDMLDGATRYANTGLEPDWLGQARRRMGR